MAKKIVPWTHDWNRPLPFGDSYWVKKSDVEPLVQAVRRLLDNIYEFGAPTENDYVDPVEDQLRKLTGEAGTEDRLPAGPGAADRCADCGHPYADHSIINGCLNVWPDRSQCDCRGFQRSST